MVDPATQALNVSNNVANDSAIPALQDTTFATTITDDLDAFRIEVEENADQGNNVNVDLRIGSGSWITLNLNKKDSTPQGTFKYRGVFHRLVADTVDDGTLGNRTLLCKLRDLVLVRYQRSDSCISQAAIRVGRPVSENDNGSDQSLHDVRELKVNVVVFSRPGTTALDGGIDATQTTIKVDTLADAHPSGSIRIDNEAILYTSIDTSANEFVGCTRGSGGTTAASHSDGAVVSYSTTVPVATRQEVNDDIDTSNERLAQAAIRPRVKGIDIGGPGDPGVVLPNGADIDWTDGFDAETILFDPTVGLTAEEAAVFQLKDSDANTIDIF